MLRPERGKATPKRVQFDATRSERPKRESVAVNDGTLRLTGTQDNITCERDEFDRATGDPVIAEEQMGNLDQMKQRRQRLTDALDDLNALIAEAEKLPATAMPEEGPDGVVEEEPADNL